MDCPRAIKIGKIAGAGGRFERCLAMVVKDCHAIDVRDPTPFIKDQKDGFEDQLRQKCRRLIIV